ncbi:LVIVD repeat-containing protein [Nocardioides sp.]|uniref:LVIVD repeat-containing protein n=1 Tax=Nocardioides sp. TaxID=35761 RepID=UPI003513BEC4
MPLRRRPLLVLLLLLCLGVPGAAVTARAAEGGGLQGPELPLNDLEALTALTGAQLADQKRPVIAPAPRLRAVPRARCGAGSRPLAGTQGRVPQAALDAPGGRRGWTCNTRWVARVPTPGGFRVWRYTDRAGRTCLYYDTSFSGPANVLSLLAGPTVGTKVVDVTDPRRPRVTATLTTPGMLAPHESLNLHPGRGLLAAAVGNGLTLPGTLDLYSVARDCRHPRLLSLTPIATGHESGWSPDGRTVWVAGGAGYIYAFDVADPTAPRELWRGGYFSHGLTVSPDGDTLFQTDPINGNLGLLDVSAIQDRRPDPQVRDLSRISWRTVSIPQNTIPFTSGGRSYLIEFDEFAFRFNPATVANRAGAARIIDVEDPRRPRIVSDLRLAVNMPVEHRRAQNDPSPLQPTRILGNAFHYCAVPRTTDPTIVACSAINSGLRIFDIRDVRNPREIGYFVAPPFAGRPLDLLPGNTAMSQPAFDPARRLVFYSDASSGLYVVKLDRRSWPRG